ncbi:MAG: S-adenosylmethionine:tRNA ribosyltransferase-isomerase [Treponema sp.]|jgi:hypothetical protein|nr:S-adenosylmethionine:tRNA ribosyltransferase-isomerase [Treponema sp.]
MKEQSAEKYGRGVETACIGILCAKRDKLPDMNTVIERVFTNFHTPKSSPLML